MPRKLSRYFTESEFLRSSRAKQLKIVNKWEDDQHLANATELCKLYLDPIREHFGRPVILTSGYRCQALNAAVGGVATSAHTRGQAADIYIPEVACPKIMDVIYSLARTGKIPRYDQVIYEHPPGSRPWVHLGISASPRGQMSETVDRDHYTRYWPAFLSV